MRDYHAFRKGAIRDWEQHRILSNLWLAFPAFFGYFLTAGVSAGVGDQRHLSTRAVIVLFFLSVVGANVCYSFGYVPEFLFGSDAPDSRRSRFWRRLLFVLGTLFAMALALVGGRKIAAMEYSFRWSRCLLMPPIDFRPGINPERSEFQLRMEVRSVSGIST